MANDLLRCQERVVADVIDRNFDADWPPLRPVKSQLSSGAPGFGFDPPGWFAKQRLLGRVKDPRLVAVEDDR